MKYYYLLGVFFLVPFIVHLFSFRKTKKMLISTVQFISSVSIESKAKSRLKHLLILANRVLLFVAMLFFFFYWLQPTPEQESVDAAVYLDNSISLDILDGASSLFDQQLKFLELGVLSSAFSSNLRFYSNDETYKLRRGGSYTEVIDEIGEAGFSNKDLTLEQMMGRFDEELSTKVIISDFQGDDYIDFALLKNDTTSVYYLYKVGQLESRSNVYIDSVWAIPDPNDFSNQLLTVLLSTENLSEQSVVIKLLQGEKQLASVVVDRNSERELIFNIPFASSGDFSLLINGDDASFDNLFRFELRPRKRVQVALISEEENTFLSTVYKNEAFFDLKSYSLSSIDFDEISSAELIVCNGLSEIPEGLSTPANEKTAFLMVPSEEISTKSYSEMLGYDVTTQVDRSTYEMDVDYSHPLLRGVFEKTAETSSVPYSAQYFDGVNGGYETIIKLRNGKPVLTKAAAYPKYFLHTPLRSAVTNLGQHALFLPLMYQLGFSTQQNVDKLYSYPGEFLTVSTVVSEVPVKLIGNDTELIPEFYFTEKEIVIKVPSGIPAGFYTLVHNSDTLTKVAVNNSKQESKMVSPSREEMEAYFEGVDHVHIAQLDVDASSFFSAAAEDQQVWKYALILIFLLILTETLIHRFIK